jgi:tetratricopeptide (TPR) repeat protein
MIRLLEAFDQGQDLDQALKNVFDTTPEELDREFREYVERTVAPLAIEPRWSPAATVKRKPAPAAGAPADPAQASEWRDGWCSVAWGYYQQGKRVDAEQALRKLSQTGELPPRAKFLQAEIALDHKDAEQAQKLYDEGFAAGGEDYRARMASGKLALAAGRLEDAEKHFLAAEKDFPGYAEEGFSAERHLADLYQEQGRADDRMRALERVLAWGSDDQPARVEIARWHVAAGRHADAEPWFRRANEIDPFRRAPHEEWGKCLSTLGRHEEALREFRVTLLVPPDLDLDDQKPTSDAKKAELYGLQALELVELQRDEEARKAAEHALELDEEEANALQALEKLDSRRP